MTIQEAQKQIEVLQTNLSQLEAKKTYAIGVHNDQTQFWMYPLSAVDFSSVIAQLKSVIETEIKQLTEALPEIKLAQEAEEQRLLEEQAVTTAQQEIELAATKELEFAQLVEQEVIRLKAVKEAERIIALESK